MPIFNIPGVSPALPAPVQSAYEKDYRKAMADELARQASDFSPARTKFVGLARALQGLMGGYMQGQVQKDYAKQGGDYQAARQKMAELLSDPNLTKEQKIVGIQGIASTNPYLGDTQDTIMGLQLKAMLGEGKEKGEYLNADQMFAKIGVRSAGNIKPDGTVEFLKTPELPSYEPNATVMGPDGNAVVLPNKPPEGMQSWNQGYDPNYLKGQTTLRSVGPSISAGASMIQSGADMGGPTGGMLAERGLSMVGGGPVMPAPMQTAPAAQPMGASPTSVFLAAADKYGANITSLFRTPEHNAQVGGVPNSQHMGGTAADFIVPPQNKEAFIRDMKAQGFQVLDEKDHLHVQRAGGQSGSISGGISQLAPKAARVQTQQDQATNINNAIKFGSQAQPFQEKSKLYDLAINSLGKGQTGPLAPYVVGGEKMLNAMGVTDINVTPANMVDAMNKEFTSIMQFDSENGRVFSGSLSNSDREFFQARAPGLGDTLPALKIKKEMLDKANERAIEIGRIALDYRNNPAGFERARQEYIDAHPLFDAGFRQKVDQQMKLGSSSQSGWKIEKVQ